MTDQSQSGPPDGADDAPGSAGDVPAALGADDAPAAVGGDDAPTVLQPDAPAVLQPDDAPTDVRPAPLPPPPPPAIAAALEGQDVEAPAAVAPLEPGDSPAVSPPPVPPVGDWRPADDSSSGGPAALAAERPEIAVGAAFAGGLVLALILKRLAR